MVASSAGVFFQHHQTCSTLSPSIIPPRSTKKSRTDILANLFLTALSSRLEPGGYRTARPFRGRMRLL